MFFFFQAEDGIRDRSPSRGLGDVYKRQGEFGAVSVVSGHIRGRTNTMPLQVEILYNEYNFVAAFAVASLLALLALLTLGIKSFIEWRIGGSSGQRGGKQDAFISGGKE